MDALNAVLLAAGALVFGSVVAGLYSARAGFSFLLVFLVVGMLAGEDGPGGIRFDNVQWTLWLGGAALGVILLDGGLRTEFATFRTGLKPALWLATVGVVATAAIAGAAAAWLFDWPWALGMLAGAVVGSTDAAAVFALMKSAGLRINERLQATLEIESGLNDPMAVFLVLALTAAVTRPADADGVAVVGLFLQQAAVGGAAGTASGWAMAALLQRLPLGDTADGLAGLMLLAAGIAVFGATGIVDGSGFLAVYLFGLVTAHRAKAVVARSLAAMDGYAWFAQALLFLLLGLLVTPSRLLDTLLPALVFAAVLMLVARPAAVALCLAPLRFSRREIGFVAWVGLRGAVPVVLALFPLLEGVPAARDIFQVAFVVVLASLVLQGATIAAAARRFGVNLPDADDEPAARRVWGDFVLDGDVPARDVCAFYGLALPPHPGTLAHWLADTLQREPVAGDGVDWDGAHFAVRKMDGARVERVGLMLPPPR